MAEDLAPLPDPAHLITQIHAEMKTLYINQHQQVQGLLLLTELTKGLDATVILCTVNEPLPPVVERKTRAFLRRR